jgi:hypothetical protein
MDERALKITDYYKFAVIDSRRTIVRLWQANGTQPDPCHFDTLNAPFGVKRDIDYVNPADDHAGSNQTPEG